MKQIMFETRHMNRVYSNMVDDLQCAKSFCDYFCKPMGFIHETSLDPFGFLLLCENQVKTIYVILISIYLLCQLILLYVLFHRLKFGANFEQQFPYGISMQQDQFSNHLVLKVSLSCSPSLDMTFGKSKSHHSVINII